MFLNQNEISTGTGNDISEDFFDDDFLDMSFLMIKKLSNESGNVGIEAEIKTANVIFLKSK